MSLEEIAKTVGPTAIAVFALSLFANQKWRFPEDLKTSDGARDPRAGRLNWSRAISEWGGAILIGCISMGIGKYYQLDPLVVGGVTGLLGLVGAATIGEIAARGLRQKVDSVTGAAK